MRRVFRLSVFLAGSLFSLASSGASLEGVWRSQGYGDVFEIHGATLKIFEVTSTTCVTGFTAKRSAAASPNREATFQWPYGEYFVRAGGADDHKLLHVEGSVSDIRIDRLPQMPAVCDQPAANTPRDNFEVFTRTFGEHYISFDLKNTNWDQVVAANRAKVNSTTTPAQLFDIFEGMIKPFGDAHTSIGAPKLNRDFNGIRPGTDRVAKSGLDKFQKSGMRTLFAVTQRLISRAPCASSATAKFSTAT